MSKPVVHLIGITKRFSGVAALTKVEFTLRQGSIHALVGENGAGKSTLLNILSGLAQPDEGEILLEGQSIRLTSPRAAWAVGIVTVHQEVDLLNDLTVTENLAWQHGLETSRVGWINWNQERLRTQAALATVGSTISPKSLADELTAAQRQLVEIAGAVSRSAKVLILDEPTSSLSASESERLFTHLRHFREQGTAIIYVSHRLEEVFALADEITVLRDGRRVWNGARHTTTPPELIRHMVGREIRSTRRISSSEPGPIRFACTDLTAGDGSFHGVTLTARGGEVLGLYGLIGAGRSEWAQAVFGLRVVSRGMVQLDGQTVIPQTPGQMARYGVAYIPEDRLRQGLCRNLSVGFNAVLASLRNLARLGWMQSAKERMLAEQVTRQLDVRMASLAQAIGTLSGGNQQKVVVGRWLARQPSVILLDEPTRGVDVAAREELYTVIRRLADQGRAVVLISSDLAEIMSQSDRIGVFREGQLVELIDADNVTAEQVAELAFPKSANCPPQTRLSPLQSSTRPRSFSLAWSSEWNLALFVVIFFGAMHLLTGRFLHLDNLSAMTTSTAMLGFCAAGAMLVLLAGGIDLSLGAIMALSAGIAGTLWKHNYSLPVVLLTGLFIGGAAGGVNAALSLLGRVHPIVVTLGTMSVYRGLTLWWLGRNLHISDDQRAWALTYWLGLPARAWLGLVVLAMLAVWLKYTVWGRELYALGSNPRAAQRMGIRPGWVWLRAFSLQGMLAGLAGLLFLSQSGAMSSTSYENQTLEAIAAAVIGGVAITGGRGTVFGLLVGCLLVVSLRQACTFLGLPSRWEQSLVGVVLLLAVLLDALQRRSRR